MPHVLGYNHRFKRTLQKTHPNIWLFIDSIRTEAQTVHELIAQIDSGTRIREKKLNPKLLKDELKNYMIASTIKKITVESLLSELSFFCCTSEIKYEVIRSNKKLYN